MSAKPGRPNPRTGIISPEYTIGKGLFHPTDNRAIQTGTPSIVGSGNTTVTTNSSGKTTVSSSGLVSINGDKTPAQQIVAGANVTVSTVSGVTTIASSGGGGGQTPLTFGAYSGGFAQSQSFAFTKPRGIRVRCWLAKNNTADNLGVLLGLNTTHYILLVFQSDANLVMYYNNGGGNQLIRNAAGAQMNDTAVHVFELDVMIDTTSRITTCGSIDRLISGETILGGSTGPLSIFDLTSASAFVWVQGGALAPTIVRGDIES